MKQASGWLFSIEIPEKSQPLAFFVRLFSKKPVALDSPGSVRAEAVVIALHGPPGLHIDAYLSLTRGLLEDSANVTVRKGYKYEN